jgi:positive regulator of sigma E activity
MWVSRKNEQIFTIDTSKNLKETLIKAISDFKRFQILSNAIYLFLFPVYYCAMIKLFFVQYFTLTTPTIIWICAALTVLSFIANFWYYRVKFHTRFKSMEANLEELGE